MPGISIPSPPCPPYPSPRKGEGQPNKMRLGFSRASSADATTLMGRTRNGKTRCSEIFARAVCHRAPSSSLPSSLVTLLFPSFSLFPLVLAGAISLGNFVYCSRAKSICDSLSRSHAHTRAFLFPFSVRRNKTFRRTAVAYLMKGGIRLAVTA